GDEIVDDLLPLEPYSDKDRQEDGAHNGNCRPPAPPAARPWEDLFICGGNRRIVLSHSLHTCAHVLGKAMRCTPWPMNPDCLLNAMKPLRVPTPAVIARGFASGCWRAVQKRSPTMR